MDMDMDTSNLNNVNTVDDEKLMQCTYRNTKKFNFNGNIFKAKCIKVYDGDTITVAIMFSGDYYKFNIRMDKYDSPELRPKNTDKTKRMLEKKWAYESRNFLSDLILNKIILLRCGEYDLYGRILGNVELNGVNINNTMLAYGYCRPYSGGHKDEWDFSSFEKIREEKNQKKKENTHG